MEVSRNKQITILLSFLILMSSFTNLSLPLPDTVPSVEIHGVEYEMKVGVILDMGSWFGKSIDICISLAISDFYALNSAYTTRIFPYLMDSKGEASRALSAVHRLLNNVKVQAIIVPESSLEGKLMALLADKAKVPFFTFTDSPSSKEYHPYLLPIKPDETTTFKAAAALVESFKWTNAVVVYEDTGYGRETLPCLVKQFHEKNIVITYSSAISPSDSDDQISKELHKVIAIGTAILIVHMSTSQASSLLSNAKKLRMVNEKYTWIITDKAIDLLPSLDSKHITLIEGVLLLKPYIPASFKLLNFTRRWRKEYDSRYPSSVSREINLLSICAYDAVWALAESYERVRNRTSIDLKQGSDQLAKDGVSLSSAILAYEISHVKFKGLTGDFELKNGRLVSKAVAIVEVTSGSKEKSVGSWTMANGISKDINPSNGAEQYSNAKRLQIAVPVTKSTFKELINAESDPTAKNWNFSGFCIDLFKAVMPLEVSYDFVAFVGADGQFSGSYNELLSMISQQVYDGTVADVTILANRSQWVDFTVPYTDLGVGMITKISDEKDKWIFFKPLGLGVWLTAAASFIVLGFVVWLFEHPTNDAFQGSTAQQIGTMLWFSFMTLYFAQRERLLSHWSRFVAVAWSFIVLILISAYTAILSSMLTVQQIQLASKGNIIGYHTGSFVQGVIVNNMNYSDYKLQPYLQAKDFADALSRGSKNGGVTAIIDEIPYLKVVLAQYPHDYTMVSSKTSTSGFGFAFQKGSPLVHDVSREISRLREDGTILMLEKKWFGGSLSLLSPESENKPKILDFGDLGGLLYIGTAVFGLALIRYMYTYSWERLHLNAYIVKIIAGGRLAMLMNYLYHRNPNWAVE